MQMTIRPHGELERLLAQYQKALARSTHKVLQTSCLLILNDSVLDGLELTADIRIVGGQVTQGSQYVQCFTKAKSDKKS